MENHFYKTANWTITINGKTILPFGPDVMFQVKEEGVTVFTIFSNPLLYEQDANIFEALYANNNERVYINMQVEWCRIIPELDVGSHIPVYKVFLKGEPHIMTKLVEEISNGFHPMQAGEKIDLSNAFRNGINFEQDYKI